MNYIEKDQTHGFVVWLTGLPGSGKTTIASILAPRLRALGHKVEVLDGDEVRQWLSPDAGFSREDRERHLKRVAHISQLLARNGIIVIASFVSPYISVREYARNTITNFIEVYVKCSLATCIKRDPKGLYAKAMSGGVKNFTGVSDVFEEPRSPEVIVDTENMTSEQCVEEILKYLKRNKYI